MNETMRDITKSPEHLIPFIQRSLRLHTSTNFVLVLYIISADFDQLSHPTTFEIVDSEIETKGFDQNAFQIVCNEKSPAMRS